MPLGRTKISQRIGLTTASKEVLRTPPGAREPAEISIRNVAVQSCFVYIKTVQNEQGGQATPTDHGISLAMGESYTWSNAPENCTWYAAASVNPTPITVEANWRDPGFDYPVFRGY